MTPGRGQFGPQGLDLQDLYRGQLNIAEKGRKEIEERVEEMKERDREERGTHTKYISSGPRGFREEDFLSFSHYNSMGVHNPLGHGQFGPRGLIGRINVGDH